MAKQDMKQNDSLFLLEVLIDKIVFAKSPCFSDKDFKTCVLIECPTVDPIEICDDDPSACCAKNLGPFVKNFNNGKSCLFSLNESDINRAMSKFPIKVSVSKALPCGCLPTRINMGEATIDMTKEFVEARKQFLEDQNNVCYQALKDSFRLVGQDASETGEIVMFLRISCFGKHITTRFQGAGGMSSIGATGGLSMADRSYFPRFQTPEAESPKGGRAGYSHMGSYPIYNVTTTKGIRTPTKDTNKREEAPTPAPQDGGKGQHHECVSGSHLCGAQFGSCPTAKDPYNSTPCENPDDPCYCSGPKPLGKQQMACRNTDLYCLHVPKDCCPTGNKVIFQMPSDTCGMAHKQRAHFNFTSDGVGDVARDEQGQLIQPTAENYTGVVYDFPKKIIKLRIGKTVEMPGRKSKLVYEFVTPFVNYEKVIPTKDTRTVQCAPCCCSGCCRPPRC